MITTLRTSLFFFLLVATQAVHFHQQHTLLIKSSDSPDEVPTVVVDVTPFNTTLSDFNDDGPDMDDDEQPDSTPYDDALRLVLQQGDSSNATAADSPAINDFLLTNTTLASDAPQNFTAPQDESLDPDTVNDLQSGVTDQDAVAQPKCTDTCTVNDYVQANLPPVKDLVEQMDVFDDPDPPPPRVFRKLPGRIRVFSLSGEDSDQQCLQEMEFQGRAILGQAPCAYKSQQIFVYDEATGALSSGQSQYGVMDNLDMSHETSTFQNSFLSGRNPLMRLSTRELNSRHAVRNWTISMDDFNAIILDDLDPKTNNRFCLVAMDSGDNLPIAAVKIVDNIRACSAFFFTPAQDDFVTGRIRLLSVINGMDPNTKWCLTYNPPTSAADLSSRLVVKQCSNNPNSALYANQRFLYNTISYHLRTFASGKLSTWYPQKYNNDLLFFWWSGNIKSYDDFPESSSNYGWQIPLLHSGSITVVDNRGYSGACMEVYRDSGQYVVRASQKCPHFKMELDKVPTFLAQALVAPRQYNSVRIMFKASSSAPTEHLTIVRHIRLVDKKPAGYLWLIKKTKRIGGAFSINRQFLLSLSREQVCTSTNKCQGHLRWSGDPGNTMLSPRHANLQETFIEPHPDQERNTPWDFVFRVGQWAAIVTSKGKFCLNYNADNYLVLRAYTDLDECPHFNIQPTAQDSDVSLVERFDFRAMFYVPSTSAVYNSDVVFKALKGASLTAKDFKFLEKFYDVYYADMGDFGDRRYRALGKGAIRSASGPVSVNVNGIRGGIYMPFYPHKRLKDPYTLIQVQFAANRKNISSFTDDDMNFLLFSFQATQGCIVYISRSGLPGVKCVRGSNVITQCQARSIKLDGKQVNLLDGKVHTVGLLYSRFKAGSARIYIDGSQIMYCRNQGNWKITAVSHSLWLFSQPGNWFFQALPAVLFKASVHTTTISARKLDSIAQWSKAKVEIVPVGPIQTKVDGCKEEFRTNGAFIGLRCYLAVFGPKGHPIAIPVSHLSLACSRPGCHIYFTRRVSEPVAHAHQFMFEPSFPHAFTSEDVGKPDPIMDLSYFADTFNVFRTTIKINYQHAPDSLIQVQSNVKAVVDNEASSETGAEGTDFARFQCLGSCGVTHRFPEIESDPFF